MKLVNSLVESLWHTLCLACAVIAEGCSLRSEEVLAWRSLSWRADDKQGRNMQTR